MKSPLKTPTIAAIIALTLSLPGCGGSEPTTSDAPGSGNNNPPAMGSGTNTGAGQNSGNPITGGTSTSTAGTSAIPTSMAGSPGSGGTGNDIGDQLAALPGICPTGFVTCAGVCLEASLIGADCRPLICEGAADATPPARAAGVYARGFDWNVAADGTTLTFKPGPVGNALSATIAVDLGYRVNGVPEVHTVAMTSGADGFSAPLEGVQAGDALEFYFHQTVDKNTIITDGPGVKPLIDTMWFNQVVGQPHTAEPAYPLTVKLAGRFRDRHPNEERYDHFVDTYFAGPTFDLTFVDNGDSVDVTVAPQASMEVEAVDFKYFECFGSGQGGGLPSPTPMCSTPPALAAIGSRMEAQGNSVWTYHVEKLSYGQLLDFELTFVRSRTYYTEWFHYFVGSGRFQPKVQHPWAHAAGDQSISDVTVDEFGYAQHVPNITPEELANFVSGKVLFEADFETHVGYNPPTTFDCPRGLQPGTPVPTIVVPPPQSPLFTEGNSFTNLGLADAVRPGYSGSACFGCHHLDGKGSPADETSMGNELIRLFGDNGAPDPMYGTVLDQHAPSGAAPEATSTVTWQTIAGQFGDGTAYELRKPVLNLGTLRDGDLAASTHVSMRVPRPVFGTGFLEAVAPETILAHADPDDMNGDGVSGRPNFVTDPATGETVLGRFDWKAGTSSLREQAALAFNNDIGITSPLFPEHRCGPSQTNCLALGATEATPALTDIDLDHIVSYMRGLSVPPRRNYEDSQAIAGKALFEGLGCVNCHISNMVTSSSFAVPELRGLNIQPFTDLLLHDMGDDLADDAAIEEGTATGSEWRTPPLWGNGSGAAVMFPSIDAFDPNGHPPTGGVYLHDGRARSITEAVLWHGGEALGARNAFVQLPAAQRAELLAYAAYPFADPLPVHRCGPMSQ